ncbi:MAG: ATP adenylyltransferase [Cyanobacteria bacterium REEB498]|nr:ATP adenylyltransferase [Cyanobacteria bacterium REEB498]
MGRYATLGLERSQRALARGALVPLATERVEQPGQGPFVLRRLLSATPKHLRSAGPKPNPFLPWDPDLEVERLADTHLVLLNKYPVQEGHLLLITQRWAPQAGWLDSGDWNALHQIDQDSPGLWFFNSCAAAGASQPHRHLQLLPRGPEQLACPLQPWIEAQLAGEGPAWPWRYRLSRRRAQGEADGAVELEQLYRQHLQELELGEPQRDPVPRRPYNLLIGPDWVLTVERIQEHWAGFSINALGFAGYLLITQGSDLDWLQRHGPWELLQAVAAPVQA